MNTCPGHIEGRTYKGCHRWDLIADVLLEEVRNLRDHRGIHAIQRAPQGRVLKHHGFQRHISGPLTNTQQGAVNRAGAVQPGRGGIGNRLVEIIMAVPLQAFAGHIGIVLQAVDNTGNTAGHGSFRIGNAVAHGVAGPDLHRNTGLPAQLLQFIDKGNHKTVEIGTGNILQMAAGNNAGIEGILHRTKVIIHALRAGHLHFLEDVIVRAGNQDTGFLYP